MCRPPFYNFDYTEKLLLIYQMQLRQSLTIQLESFNFMFLVGWIALVAYKPTEAKYLLNEFNVL